MFTRLNALVYAATNGRVGGSFGGHRVLLLTTVGCKTGHERRTPVQYEVIDDVPVIAAAGGGSELEPLWCGNLRADARATVRRGRDTWAAEAVEALGEDREQLWRRLTEINPALVKAQDRAGRQIPLFRLRKQTG